MKRLVTIFVLLGGFWASFAHACDDTKDLESAKINIGELGADVGKNLRFTYRTIKNSKTREERCFRFSDFRSNFLATADAWRTQFVDISCPSTPDVVLMEKKSQELIETSRAAMQLMVGYCTSVYMKNGLAFRDDAGFEKSFEDVVDQQLNFVFFADDLNGYQRGASSIEAWKKTALSQ